MSNNLRPLSKARNGSRLHCIDAQWAAEQAFVSARAALGWSRDKLATELGITSSTVKRWERGDAPVNPWQVDTCDEFADVFWALYRARKAELRGAAA